MKKLKLALKIPVETLPWYIQLAAQIRQCDFVISLSAQHIQESLFQFPLPAGGIFRMTDFVHGIHLFLIIFSIS